MYKVAYVTGYSNDIGLSLRQTISSINQANGKIVHIVQSQSNHQSGYTIVTITIIYTTQ